MVALYHPDGLNGRPDVRDAARIQQFLEAEIVIHGQDIQFHTQPVELPESFFGKHRREVTGTSDRNNMIESRLFPCLFRVLAYEKQGLP